MTPIKSIANLPDLDWSDIAQREMLDVQTREELIDKSQFMWQLGDVAVCGFVYRTFTNPPWMWFALARGVTLRHLIDFRALAMQIPKGTLTTVRSDFRVGHRFAQFYGFENLTDTVLHEDIMYTLYRKEG